MNLAGQLYKLQQIDLEVQRKQQTLNDIENILKDDEILLVAKSKVSAQEQQLMEAKSRQKEIEWELEDLQEKMKQTNHKLYSSKTKSSKELVNLENEATSFKKRIEKKEDELLELMTQAEGMETEVKTNSQEVQKLQQEWDQRLETFSQRKIEVEVELNRLHGVRRGLAQPIDTEHLRLYEQLIITKGQAVAKVEQGRCQGCRIALPTSQWQRVKAGDLVHCNNCNRILCVE